MNIESFANVVCTPFSQSKNQDVSCRDLYGGLVYFSNNSKFIPSSSHVHFGASYNFIIDTPLTWNIEAARGIYGGIIFNHFGHFMHESLGRLWAATKSEFLDYDIYFPCAWGFPSDDSFVWDIFDGLGISKSRIKFITENVFIEELIVPEQTMGWGFVPKDNSSIIDFLNGFNCLETENFSSPSENIIVSRSALKFNNARILYDECFDLFMKDNGWLIYYPEMHSISHQISTYSKAKNLIFIEGSASYLMAFIKPSVNRLILMVSRRLHSEWFCQVMRDYHDGNWILINNVVGNVIERVGYNAISYVDWGLILKNINENVGVTTNPLVFDDFQKKKWLAECLNFLGESLSPQFIKQLQFIENKILNGDS